jgi:hypothetical protein
MELIIQDRKEAECVALERYHQMLNNCVEIKELEYLYTEVEMLTPVPVTAVVRVLKTAETDVVRYSDHNFIDPLYEVEIVSLIKYDHSAEYAPHLFVGARATIYGETIQVLGD